jgi:hypothetical protein
MTNHEITLELVKLWHVNAVGTAKVDGNVIQKALSDTFNKIYANLPPQEPPKKTPSAK